MRIYEQEIRDFINSKDIGDVFTYDEVMANCDIKKGVVEDKVKGQSTFCNAFSKIGKTGIITKIKSGHKHGELTKWMRTK